MDKKILNTLKNGEHVVEIQKCMLHNEYVYKVTIYTCSKGIFINRIKKYTYPFYFASKEFAEEFLKYYDEFRITNEIYWDDEDLDCYGLEAIHGLGDGTYWMVDEYKRKQEPYAIGKKFHLKDGGVWNGVVNYDARYSTFYRDNINYKDILNRESVLCETDNTYIFKMVK